MDVDVDVSAGRFECLGGARSCVEVTGSEGSGEDDREFVGVGVEVRVEARVGVELALLPFRRLGG